MLIKTIAAWLFGGVAMLGFLPFVSAQAYQQHYQPFIEPGHFGHDLQFFAPASDIDDYGGPVKRWGWFGSYERLYLQVSRPEDAVGSQSWDHSWGNRWDLGYMIDEVNYNHGWLFSYTRLDGPNAWDITRQERINRLNPDDEGRPPPDEDLDPVEPPADRNDRGPPNRERFYEISDSLNKGTLNSLELNKLFRTEPLSHGGLIEPFFGVRYVRFENIYQEQTYVRYTEEGIVFPFPPLVPARDLFDITDAETEDLFTDRFLFTNDMIGGQLGMRWSKRLSRWNLSSELRMFGMYNFQRLDRTWEVERTYYDGGGLGSEVEGILRSRFIDAWHNSTSVFGTDVRAQAAFELTRDISFQAGVQYLGFHRGVGRGFEIDHNSQVMNMLGGSFGFVINR
jgi:hypothetical protein